MKEELLERIQALKKEWDDLQPLGTEQNQKLWQKLRLEWNYNSNHIEGNTLTYGETQLLLIKGQTTGDHSIREYEEMKAHDVAIGHVRSLASDSRPITEADVRDFNRILLKEPFWKEAITSDGQSTQKEIIPGQYKTTPNNVRTATGEIFHFATPEETPAKMADLVDGFRSGLEAKKESLPEFLAKFHHEFSLIHPFDDGNGRTMRLLVNYALLRLGFPPIVIKSSEKKKYLAALNFADAGDLRPFADFIADQIIWALELGIKAAKGESLEEPEDWEKEAWLFVQKHSKQAEVAPEMSLDLLQQRWSDSWGSIEEVLVEKSKPLRKLFSRISVKITSFPLQKPDSFSYDSLADLSADKIFSIKEIRWTMLFEDYTGEGAPGFDEEIRLVAVLQAFRYTFMIGDKSVSGASYLRYDTVLTKEHHTAIASQVMKLVMKKIEARIKQET